MSYGVVIPLVAGVVAAAMASAILARDPGQRANRLVALVLACSVHWSLCELLWNLSSDPDVVIWLVRLSAAGWLWLGPLTLELYCEIAGDARSRLRRLIPVAYATSAIGLLLYVTPWCVEHPIRTDFGWSFQFGPLFAFAFGPTSLWVSLVLFQWPGFVSRSNSPGERRQALWMFLGIGIPITTATVTDVALPMLGVHVPHLGSASLVVFGAIVAWSIRRYGYFLLAPGAFTHEILEILRDGVALVGLDGRIQEANSGLARLSGRSLAALRGTSIDELMPRLSRNAPAEPAVETELFTETGQPLPVSVSASALADDDDRIVGRVLVVRDLRELANLRNRLVTSGRLAAVGELAAGIADEINRPISFVRSHLIELGGAWEALEREAQKADPEHALEAVFGEGRELLLESIEGAERVVSVVRDVGGISHAGVSESEPANVNELLDNAVAVAALSYSVVVERRYATAPRVHCNPQQLKQVFLNLLINAFQAMGDFGELRLTTSVSDAGIEIEVIDDGCGIEAESLERIFDPFYTTRPTGEGTGLGLAISYQIVRNHGGEISVESEPGRGSTFRITLPVSAA